MGKITYNRGTTYTLAVNYANQNNILGQTAMFTVKSAEFDTDTADATALFKQDAAISGGTATITISPTSFADSVVPGKYFYDVKVLDTSGAIYLIDSGQFTLVATPTNRLT